MSLGWMLCLGGYAYGIKDIPDNEFQGGHGFAISAPVWGFALKALLAGTIGAVFLVLTVVFNRATFKNMIAFWVGVAALLPALVFWIAQTIRIVTLMTGR